MVSARDILLGIVLPFGVALVVLAVARRPWRAALSAHGGWGDGVAIALGFAAGWMALHGLPAFPPIDAIDWLLYATVGLVGFSAIEPFVRAPVWVKWLVGFLLAGAVMWLLLRPMITHTWGPVAGGAWVAGLAGMAVLVAVSVDAQTRRVAGPVIPFILATTVAVAGAVLIQLARSARLGQITGALAAALAAGLLVTMVRPRMVLSFGGALAAGLLLVGLLAAGHFYAYSIAPAALLVIAAPLVAWLADAPPLARLRGWRHSLIRIALTLTPLAIALSLIAIEMLTESNDYDYYDY